MEARYTANKGVLPEMLMQEMRNAFVRSEEFLDLDVAMPICATKDKRCRMWYTT